SSPAVRISRSGSAPERRQRYSIIALLALVILLLSACSTNNENFYSQQSATGMLASFEAEDAVVVQSVLTVRDETGASGGRVLVQPDTIQSAGSVRVDAYLTFTVQSPGEHFLWARVNGRSPSEDAVYIGFNGQ